MRRCLVSSCMTLYPSAALLRPAPDPGAVWCVEDHRECSAATDGAGRSRPAVIWRAEAAPPLSSSARVEERRRCLPTPHSSCTRVDGRDARPSAGGTPAVREGTRPRGAVGSGGRVAAGSSRTCSNCADRTRARAPGQPHRHGRARSRGSRRDGMRRVRCEMPRRERPAGMTP